MSKLAEINYVDNMATVLNVPVAEVTRFLTGKPFSDVRRAWYLIDAGQLLHLLPPPPKRVLDLGVGPGWTSRFLAACGFEVVGLDICPAMIALAQQIGSDAANPSFHVHDYETSIDAFGTFDAAVIYDALHHSTDEARVIRNVYGALAPGGLLVTVEPGAGHSDAPHSVDAVAKFGTTEKDMEFERQRRLMRDAGFSDVRQYYRLSELPLERVDTREGRRAQERHFAALTTRTADHGFTSIVCAVK
jgi:SAM-dependent methyltransferase